MAAPYVTTDFRAYNLNLSNTDSFSQWMRDTESPLQQKTFLHELAREGDLLTAEIVLEQGIAVDVTDEEGKRPLHEAAQHGQVEMVDFLLSCGAMVDVPLQPFGHTALYLAVQTGHIDVAQILLLHGAHVHVTDALTGQGLLHLAAAAGNIRMAGVLIEHGIDVLREDKRGQTARDYAVRARHEDMERVLLKIMSHRAWV